MNKEKIMENNVLGKNYDIIKFKDCIIQLNTGLNPRQNFSLGVGNLKYITAKNLNKSGFIDFSKCDSIDKLAKEIIHKRSDIQIGDILFASRAPVGHCHLIQEEPNFYDIGESIFSIRVNPKIILPEYMCLYLTSDYFIKSASNFTTGSVIQEIRIANLMEMNIIIPPKDIQLKISKAILSIDSKIFNNNEINNNLEELMKILYQRWFIEFEFPNEDGKPYKSSGGKFIYSEELKQKIPANWKIKKLTDISNFISGFAFSSNNYIKKGQYKLYTIKNVQDGNIVSIVDNTLNKLPINMPHECLLKPKDLIMSLTGNVGRVGLVYENNALLNQRVLKIVPQKNLCYLYSMYRNDFMKSRCEKISSGTSQKNLSPIELGKQKISYSEIIVEKFEEHNKSLIDTYVNNLIENQKLNLLKEFLLSLLMNGQINVDDIEI